MAWTLRTRGASSQPVMQDFLCDECGPCSALAPRDVDGIPCPDGCGGIAHWVISAPMVGAVKASVDRGAIAKPDSPMFLDTRELGNGMPKSEWRAKRDKMYAERRHKERGEFARFAKGAK